MYLHFFKSEIIDDKLNYRWNLAKKNKNIDSIPLGDFKKINLFVGSNNSGKSRFLRLIVKSDNIHQVLISDKEVSFEERVKKFNIKYNKLYNSIGHNTNIRNFLKGIKVSVPNTIQNDTLKKINFQESSLDNLENVKKDLKTMRISVSHKEWLYNLIGQSENLISNSICIRESLPNKKNYIPILRTIHEDKTNLKEGVFKKIILSKYNIKENIFSGLELYETVHRLKNTGKANKNKIKEFEKFLSINFFNGKTIEINANIESEALEFTIEDIEELIYNLGDGIQSLIILLFPIFTADKNECFLLKSLKQIYIQVYNEFL